jgi:hypothetical protein
MSFQRTNFANSLPRLFDTEWFCLNERLDDDALLTQEEEEYKFMVQCVTKSEIVFGEMYLFNILYF